MNFDFFKYHALGNDYIVIDPKQLKIDLNPENVKRICHRNYGVGADGILSGPIHENGKIRLRIFNPDGSEAEKSGNGIRIFSRFLVDRKYVEQRKFNLLTLGGEVEVEVLDAKASQIKVNMGSVTFQSHKIPVKGEAREVVDEPLTVGYEPFKVTCLSIGNPHCVIPREDISKDLAIKIGPLIENHELFPNRINMQLMKIMDRSNIQIEIWERGAGYTMASGSSSCAAASAAFRLGLVDNRVTVHMPGGELFIEISPSGPVFMTGGVFYIASGRFSNEFLAEM